MNAEIITIGDEILIGQIVDTNSAWMAVELNQIGVAVAQITSISDDPDHLVRALNDAKQRVSVILITGGLGPTKDDRTKKVLTEYFNSKLVEDAETLEHIKDFFQKRGLGVNILNHDQALVPEHCKVLFNPVGTAPGMWFEKEGVIYVSMPGVPFEMKQMMTDHVIPRLTQLSGRGKIVHKTLLVIGIGESILAEMLEPWEDELPKHIHLAYLPSPGLIKLRFSAFGDNEQQLKKEIEDEIVKVRQIIPVAIFGSGEETLAEVVGKLLIEKRQTMGAGESCTGGYIAHTITSVPGSSKWFNGSVVAYSNEIKIKLLGVSEHTILEQGAVSEQVVKEMAEGARKVLNVDYAVATSGIAGPDGGTDDKPVGSVWIAVAGPQETVAAFYKFANNRERNIIRSGQAALDMLRLILLK